MYFVLVVRDVLLCPQQDLYMHQYTAMFSAHNSITSMLQVIAKRATAK